MICFFTLDIELRHLPLGFASTHEFCADANSSRPKVQSIF
ncbi:hypothetical protein HMPREF1870_00873 [Bacteroidales bacterium KA00344]|nr:hypothetical protein HMPREF1870_00873 [Bacteroidales bacterium KA00344]